MDISVEHIGFAVSNLHESVSFYEKLGFTKHFTLYDESGRLRFVYMKDNDDSFFLEFIPLGFNYNAGAKVRHMGFEVESAVEAARELQDLGLDVYYSPTYEGDKVPVSPADNGAFHVFYIADPDGNQIEFFEKDALFV